MRGPGFRAFRVRLGNRELNNRLNSMRKPEDEGFQDSNDGPKVSVYCPFPGHELGLIEPVEISAENSASEFMAEPSPYEELFNPCLGRPR